jgi:hypothetical protein
VTWPLPEPDPGADEGELRPLDEDPPDEELPDAELPDEPDDDAPDEPDDRDVPVPPEADAAWCVPAAAEPDEECDVAEAAPGRLSATAPAATRLTAAAETVAARSRLRPRSLASTAEAMLPGWPGWRGRPGRPGWMLCLLMLASVTASFTGAL